MIPAECYFLKLSLYGCVYDIRVNDGPVFESLDGDPGDIELPIHQWIVQGRNELTVRFRPMPGMPALDDATRISATITMLNPPVSDTRQEIARVEYVHERDADSDVAVLEDGATRLLSANWSVTSNWPEWQMSSAAPLTDDPETLQQVVDQMQHFHSLLAAGDIDALTDFVAVRDSELAIANRVTLDDQNSATRADFEELVASSDFTLGDMITDDLTLRQFWNRRLARLDAADGLSPIYFEGTTDSVFVRVPALFCQSPSVGWVISR